MNVSRRSLYYIFVLLLNFGIFIVGVDNDEKKTNRTSKISINSNKWFVDEYGRVKMFHGLNAVQKEFPWVPEFGHNNLKNQTHLDNLKSWGFNVIRLGVMWSGIKPNRDSVNQTYINEIISIINDLAERDIYVIVDMHQDMMSSKFESYDGVPKWLIDMLPQTQLPYPWPFKHTNLGFSAYLTNDCGFAFQFLYKNEIFQYYFAEYWSIVTKTFSNYSSILAYELINEPFAGDIYRHPQLILPGKAGHDNLLPFYDQIYEVIRRYDNTTIVFYEPVTWGIILNGNIMGTGFDRAIGNDSNRTALSWHYYCWLLQYSSNPLVNDSLPLLDRVLCDEIQRKQAFRTVQSDMNIIGSPAFLTEFGVCAFNTKNGSLNTDECEYILDSADEFLQSWTYWDSDLYNNDYQINNQLLNVFSRVYPVSTCGIPLRLYYNTTTRIFQYEYISNVNTKQQQQSTEIFIPDHIYPQNSFNVSLLTTNFEWLFDKSSRLLKISQKQELKQQFIAKIIVMPMDTKLNFT